MNWFYSPDDDRRLEVTEAEFEALLRERAIQPHMLVWREGMDQWRPAGEVRPEAFTEVPGNAAGALPQPPPPALTPLPPAVPPPVPPESPAAPPPVPPLDAPTDSHAVFSLVCGVVALVSAAGGFCLCCAHVGTVGFGLAAVILGHLSHRRLQGHEPLVRGREYALAGMVLGYVSLGLFVLGITLSLLTAGLASTVSAFQQSLNP